MSITYLFGMWERKMASLFCLMCQRSHWKPVPSFFSPTAHLVMLPWQTNKMNKQTFRNLHFWSSATIHLADKTSERAWHTCHHGGSEHTAIHEFPDTPPPALTLLAASTRGLANPALVFSVLKQLKAHRQLTRSGEDVFWQALPSSFTLYLVAVHSPTLTCSTCMATTVTHVQHLRSILQVCTLTCACTQVCSHSNLTRLWWESHTTATNISDISNDFCWTSQHKEEFSNLSFPFSTAWNSYIFSVFSLGISGAWYNFSSPMFNVSSKLRQYATVNQFRPLTG